MIGRLNGLTFDYTTKQVQIGFMLEDKPEDVTQWYENNRNIERLDIEVKKHRMKRTHDANAYHWVLVSKLASKTGNTLAEQHNIQLREAGKLARMDGQLLCVMIPDTEEAEKNVLRAETYHLKPTSQVKPGKDGTMFRTYVMLKGSHEYDTKEMSDLIDMDVRDCKEWGIETLTPDEIARIKSLWIP